jgi:Protein of unknown function (DUF229)
MQQDQYIMDASLDESSSGDVALLWMDASTSAGLEAACAKVQSGPGRCTTRILEVDDYDNNGPTGTDAVAEEGRPNILLILLDPMSRSHFRRVMPRTAALLLHDAEFVEFTKYTAVGPNSGPNQAALYSGMPLSGRDGIRRDLNGEEEWLWDRLRANGYTTLKAEDGCIENSNMIQSLNPNTTHGGALQGLFCFDAFSRPNCIGSDLASTLLLNYGEQFVTTYERRRRHVDPSVRWAAFLHFVDSHEDTMILASTVDLGLSHFLQQVKSSGHLDDTVLIVTSDHGLHYGPYFLTEEGRREATEPLLHVRIPGTLMGTVVDTDAFRQNSNLWTTPFDLHETLVELTRTSSGRRGAQKTRRLGHPLTKPLPVSRARCTSARDLIPAEYCDLRLAEELGSLDTEQDNYYHHPRPSVDSFFLDIPRECRPTLKLDHECPDRMDVGAGGATKLCEYDNEA